MLCTSLVSHQRSPRPVASWPSTRDTANSRRRRQDGMRTWLTSLLAVALLAAGCSSGAASPTAAPTAAKAVTPTTAATAASTAAPASPAATPSAAATATKAATAVPASASPASAPPELPKVQGFPTRSIKLICPWDAGGGPDTAARILAAQMEKEIGKSVEVVNMVGASTQVGMEALVNSKPDGYTILYTTIPSSVTVYLDPERKASFSSKDFVVGPQTALDPMAVAVKSDSKYQTLADLVADLKANPDKIKAGDTGLLAVNHLAMLQLQRDVGSKFAEVHFTGGSTVLTALLGGHIDVAFNSTSSLRPGLQSGQVRMLAVSSPNRSKYYPDVKTYKEQGYNVLASAFHGTIWPKDVPAEIGKYLEAAILRASYSPEFISRMESAGIEIARAPSDEFKKTWQDQEKMYLELSKLVQR